MQISKEESKFRRRLFYENGYKKSVQQDIDHYVSIHKITYKMLYYKESLPDMFMMYPTHMAMKRISKSLKKVGVSIKDASGSFKNLCSILDEISEKWNEN